VLSLFVAHYNPLAPFDLWLRLGLPSYVVLNAKSFAWEGDVHNYPASGFTADTGKPKDRDPG
jgi:hypothetical protein